MNRALGPLLFAATVIAMEGVAYAAQRWVMHGPGWFLHARHHAPRTGRWEANDLYAALFAIPSIVLLFGGARLGWRPGSTWIAAGIAAYGGLYFGVHDVIVHRRIPHRFLPCSRYPERIVRAHRLHHAVKTRHGTVSFLWTPPRVPGAALRRRREAAG